MGEAMLDIIVLMWQQMRLILSGPDMGVLDRPSASGP